MGSNQAPQATPTDEVLSDLSRRIRDEEQRELAFEAHRAAWGLIDEHRELLDAFAHELLVNEVLERSEIDRLTAGIQQLGPRRSAHDLRVTAASRRDVGR
jgi:cell division protease FtsH